jgi:type I restriction enzyme S subunit
MASKWEYKKIEDIAEKVGMGPFGSSIKVETFVSEGVPIISGQHLHGFRLEEDEGFNFITEEHAMRLKNANVFRGDVIFTHAGNIENLAYIPENSKYERYVVSQRQFFMRCDPSKVLPSWVVYYFNTHEGRHKLTANSSPVGVPSIAQPVSYIRQLEIPVPPLPTQRRIADILSALDEKIELNRQTNATLEAIAQAIFREWFVAFNFPLSAPRLEGLQDYHDYAVNRQGNQANQENQGKDMVESELSPIPRGWRVGSILEIANLLSGGTPSTRVAEYWDGQIKWISAKDVSNAQGTFVLDTERKISQMGVDNSSTKLLPALTTIVTARGTVGSYCILAEPMTMNQTNYGLKAKVDNTDYFVFFSLSNLVAHLRQVSYGTIFDTVTTKTFEQSKIIIPPISEMQEFDSRITPIMQNILNNLQQTATLASLRDALLPKLMSGEMEVMS